MVDIYLYIYEKLTDYNEIDNTESFSFKDNDMLILYKKSCGFSGYCSISNNKSNDKIKINDLNLLFEKIKLSDIFENIQDSKVKGYKSVRSFVRVFLQGKETVKNIGTEKANTILNFLRECLSQNFSSDQKLKSSKNDLVKKNNVNNLLKRSNSTKLLSSHLNKSIIPKKKVTKKFVWQWQNGSGWSDYTKDVSEKLEDKYKNKTLQFDINFNGHIYKIDLAKGILKNIQYDSI